LSGQPLREISRARVAEIRRHVGDRVPLVGCGGVADAASARAMLDAGADLVQIYTALVYEGPFLPAAITRGYGHSVQAFNSRPVPGHAREVREPIRRAGPVRCPARREERCENSRSQ
jgi:tRNA-dihydrouridine synthase